MKSVYVETSIISYLAARPSKDLVSAARQMVTLDWWERRRKDFELYASPLVLAEISAGDEEAAKRRLEFFQSLSSLDLTPEIEQLSRSIVHECGMPDRASDDALHLATAAVNEVDYLLTWNCKHLANAELIAVFETFFPVKGYPTPIICTPDELMERYDV